MKPKPMPSLLSIPALLAFAALCCLGAAPRAASTNPAPAQSRLGMNLAGPADYSTEYPFVDIFRLSRAWISQRQGAGWGKGPALDLDAHGWVRRLEPGCFAETPLLTNNQGHAPAGDYVCLYEGEGTIEFGKPSRIVTREAGRIVVSVDPKQNGIWLRLTQTNPQNPVRNIHMIMPGFEKTYQTNPFYPPFLERWGSFNTFRFMDWMHTNGSKQCDWAGRPTPESATFTRHGVPVELMIDLCNRLKANPWFCLPHLASDDYVRQFAALVKARLDPSLKVYIEYSNEVWNSQFEQNRHAQRMAKELKLGPPERPWEGAGMYYGQRSVEIFKIWEAAFGGCERLVRVIAWQAAADRYWTDGIVLGRGGVGQNADALAIAPYVTFCIPAKASKGGLDAATVAQWSLPQLLDHIESKALPQSIKWMQNQQAVAQKYGLKLLCYESGQHLVGVAGGENNEAMTKLFHAANRDPRMGEIYTKYMDAWKGAGGDLMCIFSSTGAWSKWGSWGLAEYQDEGEETSPKLKAVMEWNRRNGIELPSGK